MIFGELESFINILEKFKRHPSSLKQRENNQQVSAETISARFIRLFEAHGIHRNQIPRFFDHGITLKDLKDEDAIVSCLSEKILDDVCKLFGVKRDWLDGADSVAYEEHNFYQKPKCFESFIQNLKTENPKGYIAGVLYSPNTSDFDSQAIIVLQEVIGYINNESIYRYHLCNHSIFSYWKSRAYLTACIAISFKSDVHLKAKKVLNHQVEKLASGKILFGEIEQGKKSIYGEKWYPEDMALEPEAYLKELDPELNNFGISSGLRRWLELDDEGLMNTGIPNTENPRELFQKAYEKHTA